MAMQRGATTILVAAAILWLGLASRAGAQGDKFKARLSTVPVQATTVASITGSGSATAVLTGSALSINGTFEGLQTPATLAKLHHGLKGIRGPAIFDLTITKAVSGTMSGTFKLAPVQVDALKSGKLYVQVYSEQAPDGNLWGWLLP